MKNTTANIQRELPQSDKAYEYIQTAILNQMLRPGYPLSEVELAEQLGMSRTPIREAINRLKAEGLLETVHRKGVFIKSLSKEEVRQIYEVAEGLEGMVAYIAAKNSDEEGLKKLELYVRQMEQALECGNVDQWIAADQAFHQTLYPLCNNDYLVEGLSRLNLQVHLARITVIRASVDKGLSTRDHRLAYEAIRDGDGERARQLTQNHWKRIREEIIKYL